MLCNWKCYYPNFVNTFFIEAQIFLSLFFISLLYDIIESMARKKKDNPLDYISMPDLDMDPEIKKKYLGFSYFGTCNH